MAEPQPPHIQEGATAPPASNEDRKAAAALSSLDAKPTDDGPPRKEADRKALEEAMRNLEMRTMTTTTTTATGNVKKDNADVKKVVKVDAGDVALLVDQLDLTKVKATELLRAHDANALQAMTAWVSTSG